MHEAKKKKREKKKTKRNEKIGKEEKKKEETKGKKMHEMLRACARCRACGCAYIYMCINGG